VSTLPAWYSTFYFGGLTYYYGAGLFYRPYYPGFVVVAPPVGLVVDVLPAGYSVVYCGGRPYYYASATYYVHDAARGGYVVVPEPEDADSAAANGEIFVYPAEGQSDEQAGRDRYECHLWAVHETGFDPSLARPAEPAPVVVAPSKSPAARLGAPIVGAAGGAAAGAAIGAIAGDAGKGAAIGATSGAFAGIFKEIADADAKARESEAARAAALARSQTAAAAARSRYNRALRACLEARGYVVR
jgi:hypothetical protein